MDTKIKISVYGTVYNSIFAIGDCLKSLTSQFNFNGDFEFVVVDNFSTDGTFDVLQNYSKKFKNFHVMQMKCTKGVGRTEAYRNTHGKYTFYVDLDTIYLPVFSKIINSFAEKYETGTMLPFGFMDRKTADTLMPWKDMNTYEDLEFCARAVNKGIKVYFPTITVSKNYITSGNRDRRYEKNTIKFLKRLYRNTVYGIKGRGVTTFAELKRRYHGVKRIFSFLILIKMKLTRDEIYAYSNLSSNTEYLKRNEILLDPKKFGIDNKYWLSYVQPRFLDLSTANKLIENHIALGFDRFKFLENGLILLYTQFTDRELLDYSMNFYSKY
jgi:glycosyltransferase involved in cell wall biosynthesis